MSLEYDMLLERHRDNVKNGYFGLFFEIFYLFCK